MRSTEYEFGTVEYYHLRVLELEKDRDIYHKESDYYQTELAKAHELLGRVIHQSSERWDTVRLTKFYPTNNLSNRRTTDNPTGKSGEGR